eukprot:g49725.t1
MFLCLTFLTNKSSQDQLCFLLSNFYLTNPKTSPKTKGTISPPPNLQIQCVDMLSSAVRRALPEATLADKDSFQFRYLLAQEAESRGVAEAARRFDVTYQKALWWSSKLRGTHPGLHDGHRYQTLSPEAQIALEWTVFLLWKQIPILKTLSEIRRRSTSRSSFVAELRMQKLFLAKLTTVQVSIRMGLHRIQRRHREADVRGAYEQVCIG